MVVTFYSFKGGVGRSMALANVAELLADRGYRVVACDWDLEAPGLERYFVPSEVEGHAYEQDQVEYSAKEGLVDLLLEYRDVAAGSPAPSDAPVPSTHSRLGPVLVRRPSGRAFPVSTHVQNRRGWVKLLTA